MKRLLLATTAIVALAAPALAQSDAETTVSEALMARGYHAASIEKLTDAEITELYLVLTSEDEADIQTVIAGLDLPNDTGSTAFSDTPRDDNTLTTVTTALAEAGYPEGTVDLLTDAQMTELYLVATGGDQSDITSTIDGFGLGAAVAVPEEVSGPDSVVMVELDRRGITPAQINALTSAELTGIYLAITSGVETDIQTAIDSAINS